MSTFKNIAVLLFIISGLLVVTIKGIVPGWQEGRSDFSNYYASSVLLKNGESITNFYDNDWFSDKSKQIGENEGAKFSPFPPATAFLYLPISFFKPLVAKRIWLILNVCAMFIFVFQLKSLGGFSFRNTLFFLSLFCIPLATNLSFGQCYLLVAIAITYFLNSLHSKNVIISSSFLGLVSSIKYFPVVYLLYSFPNAKKNSLFFFIAAVITSLLLPIIFDSPAVYTSFISHFFGHLNGNLPGQGQFAFSFQSIDVLLANLFILDSIENPVVLFDAPLVKIVLKLAFTAFVLFYSISSIKSGISKTKELSFSIAAIGASLIIPASATYHLLLIIPAIFVIFKWVKNNEAGNLHFVLTFIIVGFISNLQFFFIPTINYSPVLNTLIHFPRLYGLIALFGLLIYTQKTYLKSYA